jgi:predicted secreted hydrolase
VGWIDDWTLSFNGDDAFDLTAANQEGAIHLHLRAVKAPVVHGENGKKNKASASGHASHYYSIPRLQTTGEFFADGKSHPFRGESWFDHEWATGQLAEGQAGWDWICLQWEDGAELMLYQMRLKNGEPIRVPAAPDRSGWHGDAPAEHGFSDDADCVFESKTTGARYPIAWRVTFPGRQAGL